MARDVGQGSAEGLLGIVTALFDECLSSLNEERKHVGVDLLEVLADVHSTGLDDIFRLGNADSLQFDTGLVLDLLNQHLGLACVEGDAGATGSGSGSSATSMDVGLGLLRRLDLDNEIDIGDVESARGNVGGDEDAEFALLEALHSDFSLVLSDVTVHDFNVLLDFIRKKKRVSVSLSLGEDNDLAALAVDNEDVCES